MTSQSSAGNLGKAHPIVEPTRSHPLRQLLADPRQLLTVQHVDDAVDAKGAAARDLSGRTPGDLADHGSSARHRVPPQERDGQLRILWCHKGDETSLVG